MLRRVALAVPIALLNSGSFYTLMLVEAVLLGALVVHLLARPFAYAVVNVVETLALSATIITVLGGFMLQHYEGIAAGTGCLFGWRQTRACVFARHMRVCLCTPFLCFFFGGVGLELL